MHPTLRAHGQRPRYLILSAVLALLAVCSSRLTTRTFDVLALVLALCAAIFVVLALRPSSRER